MQLMQKKLKKLLIQGDYLKFNDYDDETLKHLQNVELMILKDFIKICKENNLKYYIYGGSLLGAVRHKGFIPWDDDIDVIMFREDYEKFKKIFLQLDQDKYDLLTHENYDDYFFLFLKIVLKDTKFEEWWVNQVSFDEGINIDIFVLDYVSSNKIKRLYQTKICRILDRLLTLSSIKLKGYSFIVEKASNTMHFFLNLFKIKPLIIIKKCESLLKGCGDSELVCDISALHHPQIYRKIDFGNGIEIEFEDIKVNAPINYDSILKQIYGDYMQLPPKEDRYNHITENLDFGKY